MLQCVAVCRSVLQCVAIAVCCSHSALYSKLSNKSEPSTHKIHNTMINSCWFLPLPFCLRHNALNHCSRISFQKISYNLQTCMPSATSGSECRFWIHVRKETILYHKMQGRVLYGCAHSKRDRTSWNRAICNALLQICSLSTRCAPWRNECMYHKHFYHSKSWLLCFISRAPAPFTITFLRLKWFKRPPQTLGNSTNKLAGWSILRPQKFQMVLEKKIWRFLIVLVLRNTLWYKYKNGLFKSSLSGTFLTSRSIHFLSLWQVFSLDVKFNLMSS